MGLSWASRRLWSFVFVVSVASLSCRKPGPPLVAPSETFAELRTVKRGVQVVPPGESARDPYPRERLVDGEQVHIAEGGLAWLRRDGGATLLVSGPASLLLRADVIEVTEGRLFADTRSTSMADVKTPRGVLHLSNVRASAEIQKGGSLAVYVLQGGVHIEGGVHAGPGEILTLAPDGAAKVTAALAWEDWTGGLATTDQSAEPAPFGIGTVGARKPGDHGKPRFPLAIHKLDVNITVDGDFAITEVDEVFFNPTPDTVEGIYSFRTPEGATLHRFGVDRDNSLVWGRVKEKQAAAAQYQANVYSGSTEDPALLEWDAPGVYKARLYPIKPGATRRVVVRYAEWLGRQGKNGERRLYVYPMAVEGAEASLPRIEELTIRLDLDRAGAREVRVGMRGKCVGRQVTVKSYDAIPRADLAVELFDAGPKTVLAYRAPHGVDLETTPAASASRAEKDAEKEAEYLLVPLRPSRANEPGGGLDLAIVVDTSAAIEQGALAIARATTSALLSHLGGDDRAAVFAGDATLRAVADPSGAFRPVDHARREAVASALARIDRGGATDLGAILADAASRLDPNRRSAVVYIGDGQPTVGELAVPELRARLSRLPRPVRLFTIGVGDDANMGILSGISRGAFAARVADAHEAAGTALRLLEEAERPVWLGASVDLGPGIDRIFPRELGALVADETALVIGRIVGQLPKQIAVRGGGGEVVQTLTTSPLGDDGDLRRRWAEGRLVQLLDEGAGRAAVVEVGMRSGVITPFTSLYVPTADEVAIEGGKPVKRPSKYEMSERRTSMWPSGSKVMEADAPAPMATAMADKEGGTGTRAKGEEGSMGRPADGNARGSDQRFGVAGPAAGVMWGRDMAAQDEAKVAPAAPMAQPAPARQAGAVAAQAHARAPAPSVAAESGDPLAAMDAVSAGGLGLSGIGEGGGGALRPGTAGGGLGSIGTSKLGMGVRGPEGNAAVGAAKLVGGSVSHADRVVAGMRAGFRACYNRALQQSPDLGGSVRMEAHIGPSGEVTSATPVAPAGLNDELVQCVVRRVKAANFVPPRGGGAVVVIPVTFANENGSAKPKPEPAQSAVSSAKAKAGPGKEPPTIAVPASLALGAIGHEPRPCAPSADLPFEERRLLWKERIAAAGLSVSTMVGIYDDALVRCEASEWRDRGQLLVMMVDMLISVRVRVELWRAMMGRPYASDILYRAILTRVHTATEIREMHEALGLTHIEPTILAKALAGEKTAAGRLSLLRGLATKFRDDLELALTLLEAYEDAGDDGGGRALARRLRRRSDANTRVRTSVGEYYLRLAAKASGPERDLGMTEGRRTFGEIVEFAPEDPGARRRLGDLLRAHGWYEEALRQYETLAKLAPDDASVPLLLASAAAGMGRTEEAIRWTEKASGAGAPEASSASARTARSLASAFLARARDDASHAGRKEEADRLRERARRLGTVENPESTVRVILTWSHPELHPALWSNALGAPMPAPDGDPLLGVSQALLPAARADGFVELRLEEEDADRAARIGAEAELLAIVDEGKEGERIARLPISFAKKGGKPLEKRRFKMDGGALHEELL